jgi:hypothetical protein
VCPDLASVKAAANVFETPRQWKDGKLHVYTALCESLRVSGRWTVQKRLLNLGELNT